ncbi:MAG: hypothetical protein J6D21_05195 [Clostridia bacterium]|nr:hypothetical protein [Clostridia bacterium]
MKNRLLRVTALLLVLVMTSLSFAGCASSKVYKLTDGQYGTYAIRQDEYEYFLGYYKAMIVDSLDEDENFADTHAYWNQAVDPSYATLFGEGIKTVSDMYEMMYRANIDQTVATHLVCQLLFDQHKLEDTALWAKYEQNVSAILTSILSYYGLSVATLNSYGKECGISYDLLDRIYTMQAKTACVQEYLYGANGEKLEPEFLDEFYHGSDAMKSEGYLGYLAYKPISIHTERTIKTVTDENGKVTYEVVALSAEDREYKTLLAKEIRTLLGMKGGFEGEYDYQILRGDETFEELYESYSEDKEYDTVYALTTMSTSSYPLINSLALTPVGGYAEGALSYTMSTSSGAAEFTVGVEIAKRVELEDKAYDNEKYALFFQDFYSTASTIQFYRMLKDKMSIYSSATKFNANLTGKLSICESDANTIDYPILAGKYGN